MSVDQSLLTGQVVLVGYGRVGQRIAQVLEQRRIPYVVADVNREVVERLRAHDIPAVTGDASEPSVLIQAHIARAAMLVVTLPDTLRASQMVEIARTLNPDIEVVLRSDTETETELLQQAQLGTVFESELELAQSMAGHVAGRVKSRP